MSFRYKAIFISAFCLLLFIFIIIQYPSSDQNIVIVIFQTDEENVSFKCRVANDDQSRHRGLLDVTYLEVDNGMLFSYPTAEIRVFTMKDMKVPLDIIFIDQNLTVNQIVEADIGEEYIRSIYPVQFVVEINQGIAKENDIKIGSKVNVKNRFK